LIRIWLLWSVIPILGSLDQEFILETNPQAERIPPKPARPSRQRRANRQSFGQK